jgi:AcrR family transcriptional regulator
MSKSGLYAHFGSKEELQVATVQKAELLFAAHVVEPSSTAPSALERLHVLVEGYLRYVEVDTFPGGCFFASVLAEVDMQPGPVRDRLVRFLGDWLSRLESTIVDAQAEGAIHPDEDPGQLAFEIEAALFLANAQYVVTRTAEPIEHARRAAARWGSHPRAVGTASPSTLMAGSGPRSPGQRADLLSSPTAEPAEGRRPVEPVPVGDPATAAPDGPTDRSGMLMVR